ncbi:uncharacterized protein LOC111055564 isoform X2 [Nilaparvata lugens]|uniref:uncharacterized protein LOC111055564 isoform X2 n=1 Tax=Nilaparvata lugens TaxID=108931 RepID=UPI00193D792B|nr:uncharacterized protein LOC111055564 isoform X2 [Nilaparvata lugens]
MPNELELIALETEFELYLTFTKRLVLNLPDSEDRTRAALWLQKLRSIDNDEQKKLRNEHLKLLLFALHRRSMLSVFEKPPPEELESFHDGLTLLEMTRELIELTEKKHAGGDNSGECPLPPVSTNISADLKEYCSTQSIPKFGAHVYYAVSNEPIQMWSKSPNCICPDASDVPNPLQWELTLSRLTDHVLEKQAEADRLVAEAEKGDKSEMLMKEHDDTHILPKIEAGQVTIEEAPFRWKPDSILILHNNYDFSEVGVAEDLDEQGKLQLELDEEAFGILDHSLPGRQKVIVRDPYYKGMPPDITERRYHGVVDDFSSSSSSDEMESFQAMGSTNYTQDGVQDRTRAAIWLQKLRSVTNDEQKKLRNEHLKLLLFALHRRSMLSVFARPPPEELESFHDGLTLLEMTRELIELTEKKQAGVENSGECPLPPVSTSISADLKEYCASQTIPKFGAHVYYAVSSEPIQMWSKSPNCVCPDASEIPNPLQWELRLSRLTDHVLETQAEADRLVAEAEKGDKTEMLMKEHDDTHVLPKIEADMVAKKETPFQWKPDSLLLLHQYYDFTDVGVAEDLEEQGKMQLELDELALEIVGHSLPGRQRVVVREPYYKGMPPDFSERRNHGVVEDFSSSSSSDEMESSQAMGSNNYTQDETRIQNGIENQNSTLDMSTRNLSTTSNGNLGPLARKYLPPSSKSRFGLHLDNDTDEYKVGEMSVSFEGDDILIDFDGKTERYPGTEGLWLLMTKDVEDIDYKKNNFTNSDWNVYKEIIIRANPNRGDSAGMTQFCFLSFACYLFKKWMWQVNGGEEEGKSGGDTFDVNDEGCYF